MVQSNTEQASTPSSQDGASPADLVLSALHAANARYAKRTKVSHSYYIVMIDHGSRGLEAVVHPENTRRQTVEMLASGESKHVVFIHHVDGLYVEDVTNELFDEAEQIALQAAE